MTVHIQGLGFKGVGFRARSIGWYLAKGLLKRAKLEQCRCAVATSSEGVDIDIYFLSFSVFYKSILEHTTV